MNRNINLSNIKRHFFYKNEKTCNEKTNKHITKIIEQNFLSLNEAKICNIIKKIPYYTHYFLIVEDYDFVNINQINDRFIKKINIENKKELLIYKYKNNNVIKFNDFIFNICEPKLFIKSIIDTFQYILKSLIILNENNICFFDLCPEKIVVNFDCGEKLQIQDFGNSLILPKLNEDYITKIIQKTSNYTHKPFEVHILFYLIQNDITTISYSFIEEISEIFVDKLNVLNLFTEQYKKKYKDLCIESLKKYINKSRSFIIEDILKYSNKWDVYSLSLIYLHLFGNVTSVFSLKQTFISKLTIELSKNILPEPSKRNSLENLSKNIDNLLNEENDWDFVQRLGSDKMTQLFSILEN